MPQVTLDVIGKAVFNYDFNSLNTNSPLIQVRSFACRAWVGLVWMVEAGMCLCSMASVSGVTRHLSGKGSRP